MKNISFTVAINMKREIYFVLANIFPDTFSKLFFNYSQLKVASNIK